MTEWHSIMNHLYCNISFFKVRHKGSMRVSRGQGGPEHTVGEEAVINCCREEKTDTGNFYHVFNDLVI